MSPKRRPEPVVDDGAPVAHPPVRKGTLPPRRNAWIHEDIWNGAKERAEANGDEFSRDVAELVIAYGRGDFDLDPRELPGRGPGRMARPIFVERDDWEAAAQRATADHGISGDRMAEAILYRYMRGHIRLERTVKVVEVQKIRRNLLNPDPDKKPKAPRAARPPKTPAA